MILVGRELLAVTFRSGKNYQTVKSVIRGTCSVTETADWVMVLLK